MEALEPFLPCNERQDRPPPAVGGKAGGKTAPSAGQAQDAPGGPGRPATGPEDVRPEATPEIITVAALGALGGRPCLCEPAAAPAEVDPVALARQRSKARMRLARFRKRRLRDLWKPRGVALCGGTDKCPWSAPGVECRCRPGVPCTCERIVWEHLQAEGSKAFGGTAIGGLVANVMIQCVRAELTGDPRALDHKLRLLQVLASDLRKRQDLEQRERRLQLQEAREGPLKPLADILAPIATGKAGG